LAGDAPGPGGGSAAALTTSFAAALVMMVARRSRDSWEDAAGIAAQALALQMRSAPLVDADAEAWVEALAALEGGGGDADLEGRLAHAAEIPLLIARTAADVAELAAVTAERGEGTYRGD